MHVLYVTVRDITRQIVLAKQKQLLPEEVQEKNKREYIADKL